MNSDSSGSPRAPQLDAQEVVASAPSRGRNCFLCTDAWAMVDPAHRKRPCCRVCFDSKILAHGTPDTSRSDSRTLKLCRAPITVSQAWRARMPLSLRYDSDPRAPCQQWPRSPSARRRVCLCANAPSEETVSLLAPQLLLRDDHALEQLKDGSGTIVTRGFRFHSRE